MKTSAKNRTCPGVFCVFAFVVAVQLACIEQRESMSEPSIDSALSTQTSSAPATTTAPASPSFTSSHVLHVDGLTLFSASPIPSIAESLLRTIRERIGGSPLYHADDRFSVFICNSSAIYATLTRARHGFAVSHPLSGRIIVASADLDKNIARSFSEQFNERSFTGVVSHEIGHILMARRVGFVTASRLPRWLKDGYCDYLAGEGSFPESQGDPLIATGQEHSSQSFRYLQYRRMVEYLIVQKEIGIEELMRAPPEEDRILRETQECLKKGLSTASVSYAASQPASQLNNK